MTTPQERLQAALREKGYGLNRFVRVLAHRFPELRGKSKPTVINYLREDSQPSAEWWACAAEVAGVLPRWLLSGQGPKKSTERWMAPDPRLELERQGLHDAFDELRIRLHVAFQGLEDLSAYARDPIMSFLELLYVEKGPKAFGVAYGERWRGRDSMEAHGTKLPVKADDFSRYLWARFGPVLRWPSGADAWARTAATLTLLAGLYLTESAGVNPAERRRIGQQGAAP